MTTTIGTHDKGGSDAELMEQRINYGKAAPEGIRALGGLETYLRSSGLEPGLLNLIKTRASQLNGCAYCLDMHTKDARAGGETEQRLYALPAWRATPFYTDRERVALAWTEAVTLIGQGPVADTLRERTLRLYTLAAEYAEEHLTADVAEAARTYIDRIDAMGGMLPAIERGFPQTEIAEASYRYQTEVNGGERIIVGVNRFQETGQEKVDILEVDESAQARQVAKLGALRRRRDPEQVLRALDRLKEAAEGYENLVPLLLDSVNSYATLGEIVSVLKLVFGTYSETSVL